MKLDAVLLFKCIFSVVTLIEKLLRVWHDFSEHYFVSTDTKKKKIMLAKKLNNVVFHCCYLIICRGHVSSSGQEP